MFIRQIYTSCLAQASYFIESDGEAAVIDPIRDVDSYLTLAAERKCDIRYVFLTHFHADFVSGQIELAAKTGAEIVFGPLAKPVYDAVVADNRQLFVVGDCCIKVLHTPGHTIESSCFLLLDENQRPNALFSGDTLFIGDVGRPDLMSGNLDSPTLAGMLYDSIDTQLRQLPDNVILYPGHGPGSACGKNLGTDTVSTIGKERLQNPAFLLKREAFIAFATTDQPPVPAYFSTDAGMNKKGPENLSNVLAAGLRPLKPDTFRKEIDAGAQVLDTRNPHFPSHVIVRGSLHIGLDGQFAIWAGSVIDFDRPLVLVCDEGTEKEAVTRLARIGYDKCLGYLSGGIDHWIVSGKKTDSIGIAAADKLFSDQLSDPQTVLLDVRRRAEILEKGSIEGTMNIPLEELHDKLKDLDMEKRWIIFCAGGYRSMIAASLLMQAGFRHVTSVIGGIAAIRQAHPDWIND